jgi:hypothetical protein
VVVQTGSAAAAFGPAVAAAVVAGASIHVVVVAVVVPAAVGGTAVAGGCIPPVHQVLVRMRLNAMQMAHLGGLLFSLLLVRVKRGELRLHLRELRLNRSELRLEPNSIRRGVSERERVGVVRCRVWPITIRQFQQGTKMTMKTTHS